MQVPDVLRATFDQNPALAEALQNSKPGDKLELELHVTLKSKDAEGADFTIEAVVPEGFEVAGPEEEQAEPGPTSDAMMTPAAMSVRKVKAG
jgi:uncharacterized protein YdeI (YjbR/CyaY-like superfamily)